MAYNSLDGWYQHLLERILTEGRDKDDRTGTGTLAIFSTEFRHDMRKGFPLLTTKKVYFKGVAVELDWFLKGDTHVKYLVDNGVNIWNGDAYKNYAAQSEKNNGVLLNLGFTTTPTLTMEEWVNAIKTEGKNVKGWLGPIYGHQWRNQGGEFVGKDWEQRGSGRGVDQLAIAVDTLINNPDSRRIRVDAWNAGELQYMTLPPCHTDFQFISVELSLEERINEYHKRHPSFVMIPEHQFLDTHGIPRRGLHLKWNQRSVDTLLGLPFNIASYALLMEIVAAQVHMLPLELVGGLTDTHLYKNHLEQAREQIQRSHFELPTIELPVDVTIDNFDFKKVKLHNYQSHKAIAAPLSN